MVSRIHVCILRMIPLRTNASAEMKPNRVPMMSFISFRLPAPSAWARSTCPALEKPRQTIVAKLTIWLLWDTAERPGVPTYSPTIIISMVLYSTCRALDAIKGRAKKRSCRAMFPCVKSLDTVLVLIVSRYLLMVEKLFLNRIPPAFIADGLYREVCIL